MTTTLENKNSFRATFGVIPGYDQIALKWQAQGLPALAMVAEAWNTAALEVEKAYGIYIPAVLSESRAVYKLEWGCPAGGEITVTATGSANPHFVPQNQMVIWRHAVQRTIETTKELLKQTTVTIEWFAVEVEYLSDKLRKGPTG